jgi:CheY-like chemotaxis protein
MSPPDMSKTILFTYGDGDFRKFVAALLTEPGYNLITAIDGADALHKAGALDGAIHLLLSGVELPGMTGMELAIQFNRQRPATKILLISGLDSGILTLHKDWQFLPKAFVANLLQGRIQDLLNDWESPVEHAPLFAGTGQTVSAGGTPRRPFSWRKVRAFGNRLLSRSKPPAGISSWPEPALRRYKRPASLQARFIC